MRWWAERRGEEQDSASQESSRPETGGRGVVDGRWTRMRRGGWWWWCWGRAAAAVVSERSSSEMAGQQLPSARSARERPALISIHRASPCPRPARLSSNSAVPPSCSARQIIFALDDMLRAIYLSRRAASRLACRDNHQTLCPSPWCEHA
jgi:hypothetical protein